jgi:peptidoglycan L-alanyl-D-glutamate endopeptidase CwlK
LVDDIKAIQRHCGADPDGVFGPRTAAAVLRELRKNEDVGETPTLLDARTLATIATLDVKAQAAFTTFALLAKATAATFGCDYVAISGHRTWKEQDELYFQTPRVTNAKGGFSNHNFGIAADFAVFRGKVYLDDSKPELARQVHTACAAHATDCGLEWGGDWKRTKDYPHYELKTGLTMAEKRKLYWEKGTVL